MKQLLIPAFSFALGALLAWLFARRRTRRLLERLNAMLDAALQGDFRESAFDESLQSAVETRMARYLSASERSTGQLEAERTAIKQLIGDISHQTKTPIANLLLYTQLLGEQELPETGRALAASVTAQAEKLRFLIEALVKVSRLESGVIALHPVSSPIMPLMERVAEQIAPQAARKGIDLTLIPTDSTAFFDEKWTVEALYNLVDNAVKYTPPGGAVTVRAIAYELFCRIDVQDTGPGIPERDQPSVFARFWRGSGTETAEGVGIGLYLTRQIAAGQGGYVKVNSAPGRGSTFSLFLSREQPIGGNLTEL